MGSGSSVSNVHRSPYIAMFTGLDFGTDITTDGAVFGTGSSDSGRHVEYLQLKPFSSSIKTKVMNLFGSDLPVTMVDYLLAVSAGHWRTLEALISRLKADESFMSSLVVPKDYQIYKQLLRALKAHLGLPPLLLFFFFSLSLTFIFRVLADIQ